MLRWLNEPSILDSFTITSNCSDTENKEKRTITSPNYPSPYPSNTNCVWKLIAPTGKHIRLHFKSFVTEENHDKLNIFEYENFNVLRDLSGTKIPRDIISTSNKLTLTFKSNGVRNEAGFEILYDLGNCKAFFAFLRIASI